MRPLFSLHFLLMNKEARSLYYLEEGRYLVGLVVVYSCPWPLSKPPWPRLLALIHLPLRECYWWPYPSIAPWVNTGMLLGAIVRSLPPVYNGPSLL